MGDNEEYERESENDWYDTLFAHLVMLFVLLIVKVWLEYNCNSCIVSFSLMLHIPVVPNITLLFFFVCWKVQYSRMAEWVAACNVRGENPPGREYAGEEIITWPCPHHLDVMMSGFGRICGGRKRIMDIYVTAALENLRHYRLHCDAVLNCWQKLSFLFVCCCSVFC